MSIESVYVKGRPRDVLDIVYTDRLRKTLVDARTLSVRRNDTSVGPEHFFLSIDHGGCANATLDGLGFSLRDLQKRFDETFSNVHVEPGAEPPYSEKAGKIFDCAKEFARSLKHNFLGDEHLIWALVEADSSVSVFLKSQGLSADAIQQEVMNLLGYGIGE